ncbi:erythromycin esterase-like protein [Paraburkholderia sp. GAS199]|uniref:hypothetical protein n=1 Tax=Paraburkholderia sp. GAS199 TaxID=3035126 RepID=UPI003D23CF50
MSKEDLSKRIATAKLDLNTALLTGDPTAAPRAALRALEAQHAAIEQQEAAQVAAQQAAKQRAEQAHAQSIDDAAAEILAARNARLAAMNKRFSVRPIFDARGSSHA